MLFKASIAARALLIGFLLRERSLPVTSVTPASSSTLRTEDPATRPRPGDGRISMTDAQYFACTLCAIERFSVSLIVIIWRFAARVAFSIASCVSAAFPRPTPTRPCLSPITMQTLKLKRRQPAMTRATRRMLIIFCANSLRASRPPPPPRRPPRSPPRRSPPAPARPGRRPGVNARRSDARGKPPRSKTTALIPFSPAFFASVAAASSARSRGVFAFSSPELTAAKVVCASSSISCATTRVLDLYIERRGRIAVPCTLARTLRCRTSLFACLLDLIIDNLKLKSQSGKLQFRHFKFNVIIFHFEIYVFHFYAAAHAFLPCFIRITSPS